MSIWTSARRFFRALFSPPRDANPRPSSSLARTLRDSTHARVGGMSPAGTEQQHRIAAEHNEDYTKSLDKDK
jgi:hypothetical protein